MGVRLRKLGKSGNYYMVVYDGARTPKETSYPLGTTRKDVATRKFVKAAKEYEEGRLDPWAPRQAPQQKVTLGESIQAFLGSRGHLRPRTVETYEGVLSRFLRRLPPNLMLAHLTGEHISSFVHDTSVSRATQQKRYAHLRAFGKWASAEGYVEKDPMGKVRRPKPERRLPSFLTPQDLDRLLAAIEADYTLKVGEGKVREGSIMWLRDAVLLAVSTGLRRGELLNLHWSDVDTVSGWLHVRNRGTFRTKGGGERSVPLTPPAKEVLERLRSKRLERGEVADGPVMTGEGGGPLYPNLLTRRFKHYVRLAKLDERLRFHDLRHTCASWLAQRGVSLQIIAAILGHADSRVAEQFYAHLQPDTLKRAMEETFGRD